LSAVFSANHEPDGTRICPHCRRRTKGGDIFGGHDPCIANLPGVVAACCGHAALTAGGFDGCYVEFENGTVLRGDDARAAMRELGGDPPP
jgi:hypothetical protein